jgi:ABC-2 type transport system permease protein
MAAVTAPSAAPLSVRHTKAGAAVVDGLTVTWRNLKSMSRTPEVIVFSTIQPIIFVLTFRYVFGGAIQVPGLDYVDFLMPGIFVQTAIFASTQTGVGLADDLQKGLIDRFRSLPMARSAVLAGRTAADAVSVTVQTVLMLIVAYLVGYRLHEGGLEALLAFVGIVSVGYAFTWVSAFAGLSLKTVEAVQAALFTIVFPFVFVSSAFVPVATFDSWLQPIARNNPVTIWANTVRVLTLGDRITESTSDLFADIPSLGNLLWVSTLWLVGILVVASFLGVRKYRQT